MWSVNISNKMLHEGERATLSSSSSKKELAWSLRDISHLRANKVCINY